MPEPGRTTGAIAEPANLPRRREDGQGKAQGEKKRPLPGIWNAKDGPGPAAWRKHDGHIHGWSRRKGERNPRNFGYKISGQAAKSPVWVNSQELPPLSNPKAEKKKSGDKKKGLLEKIFGKKK